MIVSPELREFMKAHGDYVEEGNALYFIDGACVTGVGQSLRNPFYEANPKEYQYLEPPADPANLLYNRRLYCDTKLTQELKAFDAFQRHLHTAIHNHAQFPQTCAMPTEEDFIQLSRGKERVEKLQLLEAELEHEYQQEPVGRHGETRAELKIQEAQRQAERSSEINAAQQRLAKCMPAGVTEQDLEAIRSNYKPPAPKFQIKDEATALAAMAYLMESDHP